MAQRYRIPQGRMDALTPIGQALNNVANLFLSMPSREERAFNAARAENTGLEAELNRRRIGGQDQIRTVFGRAFGALPEGVTSPDEFIRSQSGDLAGALAGTQQTGQIPDLFRFLMANRPGSTPEGVTRSQLGAGQGMGTTVQGFSADQSRQEREAGARNATSLAASRYATDRAAATQDRIDARTLAIVEDDQGRPTYVPRTDAVGRRPAATPGSAAPRMPDNFMLPDGTRVLSFDGRSYAHPESGAPTPLPSNAQRIGLSVQAASTDVLTPRDRSEAETSDRSREAALRMMQRAYDLSGDQRNFGAAGAFRGFVQDATQQAMAIAQLVSPEAAQRIRTVTEQAQGAAQTPGFDPTISQLNMVLQILPFQLAQAVAQQSGRGLSNADVDRWTRIVGSMGPTANQAEFRARMDELAGMVRDEINISRRSRQMPEIGPEQWFRGGGAAPAAAAPTTAPRRIRLAPDGSVRQ